MAAGPDTSSDGPGRGMGDHSSDTGDARLNRLSSFYAAGNTKQDLAWTLARIVLGLDPVPAPPPEALLDLGPPTGGGPGRPTAEITAEREQRLLQLIVAHYPHEFACSEAAELCGMSPSTVEKLQEDPTFLDCITTETLRQYFRSWLRRTRRYRLPNIWRDILDVHNYMLLLETAQEVGPPFVVSLPYATVPRLDLFTMHAAFWGQAGAVGLTQRAIWGYNGIERARLQSPTFVGTCEHHHNPQVIYEGDQVSALHDNCPITAAYYEEADVSTVGRCVSLLKKAHPVPPVPLADETHIHIDEVRALTQFFKHPTDG